VKFEFDFGRDDYIDFNIYHLYVLNPISRKHARQRYAVPILYLFLIILYAFTGSDGLWLWATCLIILSVLWFIYYPKFRKWLVRQEITKAVDKGINSSMLGLYTLEFDDEGISQTSKLGSNRITWDGVKGYTESETQILIYVSENAACVVPKRLFASEDEKQEFLNYLNERLAAVTPPPKIIPEELENQGKKAENKAENSEKEEEKEA